MLEADYQHPSYLMLSLSHPSEMPLGVFLCVKNAGIILLVICIFQCALHLKSESKLEQ